MTSSTTAKPRKARRRKPKPEMITVTLPEGTNLKRRPMQVVLPKPNDDIIPLSSYVQDTKNRWKIHQYEIKELSKDIQWLYSKSKPYLDRVRYRISPKSS
tara:strand:- start:157 stop:456 length:300 start_codon:yes stop_codon:yes gene_type:complete